MGSITKIYERHGLRSTVEYYTWAAMLKRCYTKTDPKYYLYGGRGITVCERWFRFTNFYEDMGLRPSKKYSIDRINNNKGYSPDNCRWATKIVQQNNLRTNRFLTYNGETHSVRMWERKLGMRYGTIDTRLRRKWTTERAITTPIGKYTKLDKLSLN